MTLKNDATSVASVKAICDKAEHDSAGFAKEIGYLRIDPGL